MTSMYIYFFLLFLFPSCCKDKRSIIFQEVYGAKANLLASINVFSLYVYLKFGISICHVHGSFGICPSNIFFSRMGFTHWQS